MWVYKSARTTSDYPGLFTFYSGKTVGPKIYLKLSSHNTNSISTMVVLEAPIPAEPTSEWLEKEIKAAEDALDEKERRLLTIDDDDDDENNDDDDAKARKTRNKSNMSVTDRLGSLDRAADDLLLAQDVAAWVKSIQLSSTREEEEEEENDQHIGIIQDAQDCVALGEILCRHAPRGSITASTRTTLYTNLFQQEYLPLYKYLSKQLVASLRRDLQRSNYPSSEACRKLIKQSRQPQQQSVNAKAADTAWYRIVQYCIWIRNLQAMHKRVIKAAQGTTLPDDAMDPVLLELCQPLVEKVRFHFVTKSNDRPASSRIDRLPEWLLSYITDNVLQGGPWELIVSALAPALAGSSTGNGNGTYHLPLDFLNELVRLVQWVLGERNFFRDAKIAGHASKPALLCNAVEQFIQFDDAIQNLLENGDSSNSNDDDDPNIQMQHQKRRLLSLMDIFIAGDEELLQWWLERERETVFFRLFQDEPEQTDTDTGTMDATTTTPALLHRVSPRAELFCALIRSIQAKAAVFSFSGPYLHYVASPVCLQFLDVLQETAGELRQRWSSPKRRSSVLTDVDVRTNVTKWIELINGTHMAAEVVACTEWTQDDEPDLSGREDLARFGRSLVKLEDVLLDEFAASFVDTFLLERARFAGYLMRCSHLLASDDMDAAESTDVSPDLQETHRLLGTFLNVCDEILVETGADQAAAEAVSEIAGFAPRGMRDRALDRVASHLLEVALDVQGMTPDLFRPGAMAFARDVNSLFAESLVPPSALRLLDILELMTLESRQLAQLGNTLCGLAGQSPPLNEEYFTDDSRLFEEAMSMIRAKGLVWIELGDVFVILNRRRDL
jgi:hypothetical protein